MRLSRFQRRMRLVSLAALLSMLSVFATAQHLPQQTQQRRLPGAPLQAPAADGAAADSFQSFTAAEVAERLLSQIRKGLEARNSHQMLAAFDHDRMPGYLAFQDQVEAFLAQHDSFRVYLRVESASLEKDGGSAVVQATLEFTPIDGSPAVRRQAELSFEFGKTEGSWKIVDFGPRGFFS